MEYAFFNINDFSDEMTRKYYPMLTPVRQKKLLELEDAHERAVLFCAEICARQCLAREFRAPEYSFNLLVNLNSSSVVSNYSAAVCILSDGDVIGCAVDRQTCGIGMCKIQPFEFKEAQEICSDREIRDLFSFSAYSFTENVCRKTCDEPEVIERFALYKSLKDAYFKASGRAIKTDFRYADFDISTDKITCSDPFFTVAVHEYHKTDGYVLCVLTKSKS